MKSHKHVGIMLILVGLSVATAAHAQIAAKKGLTIDGAKKVIAAAIAESRKLNAPGGVIAVVDDGGNLIALERLDGTFAAGANISIGKARTAVLFKKPTKVFEEIIKNGRTSMVALNDFTPLQGGIPIVFDAQVIGGVGVSGAASAAQDEQLAIAGAEAAKDFGANSMEEAAGKVSYYESEKVRDAFSKGAVLFDGGGGARNYMVHASRRMEPGMAEIHTLDTDIVYVLEGTATLITGGTAVDPKITAPNELRGSAIQGGDTWKLKKGDVVIVPQGTPHWFKEVQAPFLAWGDDDGKTLYLCARTGLYKIRLNIAGFRP